MLRSDGAGFYRSIARLGVPIPVGGPVGGRPGVEPVVVATVVWRVVVLVAEGSLEQDTSIKARTESAEPSMIALFINIYCLVLSFANL